MQLQVAAVSSYATSLHPAELSITKSGPPPSATEVAATSQIVIEYDRRRRIEPTGR